jgi:hypothetical protein
LGGTEYNISSPFSGRGEQGKAQDIGGNGYFAVGGMGFLYKGR